MVRGDGLLLVNSYLIFFPGPGAEAEFLAGDLVCVVSEHTLLICDTVGCQISYREMVTLFGNVYIRKCTGTTE